MISDQIWVWAVDVIHFQIPDGFTDIFFSGALAGKGKWTDKNLDKYLKSPADYAPGNAMAFAGVPNAKDRADIIAYLKEQKWETELWRIDIAETIKE